MVSWMNYERFLEKVRKGDEFRRKDLSVEIDKSGDIVEIQASYIPKKGYHPEDFEGGQGVVVEQSPEKLILKSSGRSDDEALRKIYDYLRKVDYPDRHETRKAGARIVIEEGEITVMEEPRIEYCPLTEKVYGGCDKCDIRRGIDGKIDEGMYTPNRKVCQLENHIPYGTSEMLKDAVQEGKLDSAVLVCEGAGTVITNRPAHIQGIGEKMTGLYYTTPIDEVIEKLEDGSRVLYPFTARIDQVEGVKAALDLGYEKVAVTFATHRNKRMDELNDLDGDLMKIALCTTGIERKTAEIIRDRSDLAWACASKYLREVVGPNAILQIGLKIPVYALTEKGCELASTRLERIEGSKLNMRKRKKYLFTSDEGLREVENLPIRSEKGPKPLI